MSAPAPARSSVALHWIVAIGIVGMPALGFYCALLPRGELKSAWVQTHKSFGMFALAVARIAWRARVGFPEPASGRRIERGAAIVMPLSGIARSLAYARSVEMFGVTVIPKLLAKKNGALNDVMPVRAGYDAKTGRWLLVEPRTNIPSSVWLPEVGRGRLDPTISAYFSDALVKLTEGQSDRPLVFYCLADCWMSWNAVKRAASLGYGHVYWCPDGSDGWRDADRPLAEGAPWPVDPALIAAPARSTEKTR